MYWFYFSTDVARKTGLLRSVDWIIFMQFILPTLVFEQLIKKYGSNAPQVEAIMAFVIGCSTALKWKITQQDIAKIKS